MTDRKWRNYPSKQRGNIERGKIMACYIVTFEVNPAKLAALETGIKSYGNYCPVQKNVWAIVTPNTAVQVREHLSTFLDLTDRIFVFKSGVEGAWRNAYGQEHSDWLKKNL